MSDLKPCPWCGGSNLVYNRPIGTAGMGRNILCKDCQAEGPLLTFESGTAHDKWNSRTPDPRLTVDVVGRIIGIVRSELGDDGNSDNDSFFVGLHDKLTEALANIGELG